MSDSSGTILGTRVARRVLIMFALGAILPVGLMAVLSFSALSNSLRAQSEARLGQFSAVATQSILERLLGFQTFLASTGSLVDAAAAERVEVPVVPPPGVEAIVVDLETRRLRLAGTAEVAVALSPENQSRLSDGRPVLIVTPGEAAASATAYMGVPAETRDGTTGVVWARIVADSIWAGVVTQAADPTIEDLCILGPDGNALFCMHGTKSHLPGSVPLPTDRTVNAGSMELAAPTGEMLVAWRDVYLRPAFNAAPWTVAVSQPTRMVYAAADGLLYNLGLSLLLGLCAVLLLTHAMVRHTMQPLRALTEGTEKIARQDLSARVAVTSRDEFGDLARSFNSMAHELGLQFRQLNAARAIDQTAISAADGVEPVNALLQGLRSVVSSGRSAVLLPDFALSNVTNLYSLASDAANLDRAVFATTDNGVNQLRGPWSSRVVESEDQLPPMFRPWASTGGELPALILPLRVGTEPFGLVVLGRDDDTGFSPADRARAEALVDQSAVAITKLRLDRELAAMSWETLRALANAIDAKSPWTAGHSERVTDLALLIGRELQLDSDAMDTLHRGGLLHDIGKIGVPVEVLDFDGPLDEEKLVAIRSHPEAGARILEPIRAFTSLIPIVLYHHERWDGHGYPEGLAGERIPYLARVLAVADVFDAMVSARPYRPALDPDVVLAHIVAGAGKHHDPDMVRALERVVAKGWRPVVGPPEATAHA